jgi:tetratricopeptide (TPR) repeat protein
MKHKTFSLLVVSLMLAHPVIAAASHAEKQTVKIWEEPLVIPTYSVAPPEKNPMFYNGEVYQGAKKVVYPYSFLDKLTDVRENKTYKAVYLENEYIKVSFLPELGGRLFSATDKTNNYDFFYRQHVIKPALIGMLGAWISGGIEWCVLHHHRATTFMPVDYTLAENPDGSKTLWFGEIERRHRMKWVIAATLYPGKSCLEVTVKIFNRTPLPNSFLYWANVAVHANPDYQVIFPPSTQFAAYHAKNDFVHWPIADETYQGVDYRGIDLSWWKNHPEPTSFFAWDLKENFSGGYDHGKKAGVIHVGNHHVLTGAKLWEWGPGTEGQMWDKILTDADGPYAELMVGAFSDNQPDYSWIKPYEVKTFTHCWYPIREIGSVKNANLNAAVNLELSQQNVAKIGFNTTSKYNGARILLTAADKVLFEQKADLSPDKPFTKEIAVPTDVKETDLKAFLFSSANEELISYSPASKTYDPNLPPVVKVPPAPQDINTIEELYLTGLRIEQFHNPTLDASAYYQEALNRDPGDSRVNTALAIDYNRRAMYPQAEEKLNTATQRISANYTKPRNAEAYYYLGLAQKAQGKYDEAYDSFYRASWDNACHCAAYYQLAEIASIKGNSTDALEQINRSISTNALNTKALNTKTVILRHLGRLREARATASQVLDIDPLDFWAINESYLLESAVGSNDRAVDILNDLKTKMRDNVQSYLELAVDYTNLGRFDEAIEVLTRDVKIDKKSLSDYPLVYYYLGFCYDKKGSTQNSSKYYKLAAEMPPDYCFPFRTESIDVLKSAIEHNPSSTGRLSADARAYYYLGNLLYDIQPDNAVNAWEKSKELDASFPTVHRNLGWAYFRAQDNVEKAITSYEKAITCDSNDPRLFAELDVLYEAGGHPPQKRLALLEKNHQTVIRRDDSFLREIMLLVQLGRYDAAVKFLTTHHFHTWEGGGEVHNVYIDAFLLRGRQFLADKQYQKALDDFKTASEYPQNLEVARPTNDPHAAQVNYFIATALQTLGDEKQAAEYYEKAAYQQSTEQWPQARYYQGLSLVKLGQKQKAEKIFAELITTGQKMLTEKVSMDFFAKFGQRETQNARLASGHYIIGLGHLGSGQTQQAKHHFQEALKLNINHLWAKIELSDLE